MFSLCSNWLLACVDKMANQIVCAMQLGFYSFFFQFQVYPIIDFPNPEISLASQRAITEHNAAFTTSSRILQQVSREARQ